MYHMRVLFSLGLILLNLYLIYYITPYGTAKKDVPRSMRDNNAQVVANSPTSRINDKRHFRRWVNDNIITVRIYCKNVRH